MAFVAPLLGLGAAAGGTAAAVGGTAAAAGSAASLSSVLGTVGAVASGVGTIYSGLYSAQVAKNNAKVAEQNADYARKAGQQQAEEESMKGAQKVGAVKAAQAASGVDVNSGSALDTQIGQREVDKLDTETILNNAELQAYGYTTQAQNFKAQASQDAIGGVIGGIGTLASKASAVNWGWGS